GVWRQAELGAGTRLWAGQATSDWIRLFPRAKFGNLGLGRPPLHREFQATRFDTGDIGGHCSYYTKNSESVRNIARIALGRYEAVSSVGTTQPTGPRPALETV